MSILNKIKDASALVRSVVTLDDYFSELVRLSAKIEEMDMKSDFDFEQIQKLLNRFAECGQNVSNEVMAMSAALNEARGRAEAAAKIVGLKAAEFQESQSTRQGKMEQFRLLGEKVNALNASLIDLKRPEGVAPTEEELSEISLRLSRFQDQLNPLIVEAETLKNEAQALKMKILEQGADSLRQSLLAVSQKLMSYQQQTQESLQ